MWYYSPPVTVSARFAPDISRVSMDDFIVVVLGMVISPWVKSFCSDTARYCRLIISLSKIMRNVIKSQSMPELEWLDLLSRASERCLRLTGIRSERTSKLLGLGVRSGGGFIGDSNYISNVFGLSEFDRLLGLLRKEHMEDKDFLFRRAAKLLNTNSADIIVRYHAEEDWKISSKASHQPEKTLRVLMHNEAICEPYNRALECEYASVFPLGRDDLKRAADGTEHSSEGYHHWVVGRQDNTTENEIISYNGPDYGCAIASGRPCFCKVDRQVFCTQSCHPENFKFTNFREREEYPIDHPAGAHNCESDRARCHNATKRSRVE